MKKVMLTIPADAIIRVIKHYTTSRSFVVDCIRRPSEVALLLGVQCNTAELVDWARAQLAANDDRCADG